MDRTGRTLIIVDGGLEGLLACMAASEAWTGRDTADDRDRPAVWVPHVSGPSADVRHQAAERQADLAGLAILASGSERLDTSAGRQLTQVLVDATYAGAEHGFQAVLWPVHGGLKGTGEGIDLEEVTRCVDRALLVSRLVSLDAPDLGSEAIRIETPYADFSDRQIAELAIDLDLPVETCWWWPSGETQTASEARAEQERWLDVLQAAGWVQQAADTVR